LEPDNTVREDAVVGVVEIAAADDETVIVEAYERYLPVGRVASETAVSDVAETAA
jgi:hypothetical protein